MMEKQAIEDSRRVEVQRRFYSIRLSTVFEKSRLRARRNGTRETARWNSERELEIVKRSGDRTPRKREGARRRGTSILITIYEVRTERVRVAGCWKIEAIPSRDVG